MSLSLNRAIANMSIEQLIVLVVVNLVGVLLVGGITYFVFRKTPRPKTKMAISIGVAIASIVLWAIICVDLGLYFWIQSGNFRSVLIAIPLLLFGAPTILLVVSIGTYVQLIYRDKIQEYTNSIIRKHTKSS